MTHSIFDRNDSAYSSRVVNLNIEQLKRNLRKPISLKGNRPWFLQVFPMPVKIQAGTLHSGAIHKIDYVYKRWFFTNTHKGQMILKIKNVGENFVITEILKDTSYISNYLELKGTHIKFDKLDNNRTKVTLRIFYKRHLDPSWYFGPMERYAISQMSRYMIRKIIVRD